MGSYQRGDVVLVPVRIRESGERKVRPAVVVKADAGGDLIVCPVSQKPAFDTPSIPIGLPDFAEGGLDIHSESYILTSLSCKVKPFAVRGKKGRLREEVVDELDCRRS
ncbi:MAG: type II toxin-antitoxin system PemK/MazF family toxin [Methanolinea sp.]|nr:type II toxin-antitoxin system PemK/MazF family toxin [Methanolinea sp.]